MNVIRRSSPIAAIACAGLILLGQAAAQPMACNANAAQADAAQAMRYAKNYDGAKAIADQILRSDANDFRANYTEALILFDQSNVLHAKQYDAAKVQEGLKQLDVADRILQTMSPDCLQTAAALGWGGFYNTQGVYYFAIGDKDRAKRIWLDAYNKKLKLMSHRTQILLLNNLALLYDDDNLKQPDVSAKYRREALALEVRINPKTLTAPTTLQKLIPKFAR